MCRLRKLHCVSSAPSCSRQRCALTQSGCSAMLSWRLSCTKLSWLSYARRPALQALARWIPSILLSAQCLRNLQPLSAAGRPSIEAIVACATHSREKAVKTVCTACGAGCGEPCSGGRLQHDPHWSAGQGWLRGQPAVCLGPCRCHVQSCALGCCAAAVLGPASKYCQVAPRSFMSV